MHPTGTRGMIPAGGIDRDGVRVRSGMTDPETPAIVVVEYDPAWPEVFARVRATVWPVLYDLALRNHLAVRDHLRAFPASVRAFGALKRRLARAHPYDIDAYLAGKTDFVLAILSAAGFGRDELEAIERVNRPAADGR